MNRLRGSVPDYGFLALFTYGMFTVGAANAVTVVLAAGVVKAKIRFGGESVD